MNKLLITGSNGLVGSHFKGDIIPLTSSMCDLRDTSSVNNFFESKSKDIDGIIHCAAKVGGIGGNMNDMGEYFYDNLMINTNIIEASRKFNVKKLLVFSSTCVFPTDIEYPLTEDKIHLGVPHETNYGYAYAKRMADIQLKAYNEQYKTKFFSVIPCNMYGPNDNYNLETSHVLPSLIHKTYLAKLNNTPLEVWGSGKPMREFIFSRDVSKICLKLMEVYDDTKPIILSPSNEISIEDVVGIITKIMKFDNKIIFNKEKPDGQFRKPSDNSYLKSIIGDFEFTKIEDGIEETIEFFLKNYKNLRMR